MRRLTLSTVVMLLLGVAAGLVWLWLADPADWRATEGGIVLTEAASKAQFPVVLLFASIGAVTSAVWAFASARSLADLGWVLTPFVVVVSLIGAVVAWRVGVELGPPDPSTVTGARVGELVPARLQVDSVVPFLVWPILALVGAVVAVLTSREPVDVEV